MSRPNTIVVLAAVTLAALAVAGLMPEESAVREVEQGALLFPDLSGAENSVTGITITHSGGSLDLAHRESGWVATSKHGYPVKFETVKKTIVGLSGLRTVEAKTARPEAYERLSLRGLAEPGSQATLVRLSGADEVVLAELLVGKQRRAKAGAGPGMTYVRKPAEAGSWLAAGDLRVDRDFTQWLERTITDIPGGRIREVRLSRAATAEAAAEEAVISRPAPGGDLVLGDLAPGAKAKIYELGYVAGALSGLDLDDVRPRAGLDFAGGNRIRYQTFDGLVVDISFAEADDATWLALDVSGAEADEGGDEAETPRETAEALAARTAAWAFKVPGYSLEKLRKRKADLVEEPKDESEP